MKSIKATTIIEGPEEVFISKEANNPTTTDKIPDKIAITIICLGLLLMFLAIAAGIKRSDEVITTPFTYMATVEAIMFIGAKPVLVDIDPKTGLISINNLEKKLHKANKEKKLPKILLVVHLA